MRIEFISLTENFKLPDERKLKIWIKSVIERENKKISKLDVIFVTRKNILEINTKFLNHNYVTDIITFNRSFLNEIAGEIYICCDVVKENSVKYEEGYFYKEVHRVIIHGILHLLGFNDRTEIEKGIMHQRESELLSYLEEL